ncbi:hypothetical protein ABGT22_27450, partial [Peribacillus frigoritolerans]|uniref:hypothetical protein n=1 Tax=Peribacillus frigoritolerans TaxID=450367 RepID=UPI00345D038F
KVRDSCGTNVSRGDPAGGSRGGSRGGSPDRPRKASAWSGNQRSHFINPQKKTVGKQKLSSL